MESQSLMDLLGFDPGSIGFESAARSALTDPTDMTAGLFRSLVPFEEQYTNRATTQQLGSFGQMGGRFSRNAVDADTLLRGQLGAEFARTREQALLDAAAQRNQALAALMGAVSNAQAVSNQRMASFLNFLQPGSPNFQEGIFGDLLGAGGNLLGILLNMPKDSKFAFDTGASSGISTGGAAGSSA